MNVIIFAFLQVDKSLQSIEKEAERIYKDECGLLLEDEAASTRDSMLVPFKLHINILIGLKSIIGLLLDNPQV